MSLKTVEDIERAITELSPSEIHELYTWIDEHGPQTIDELIESGLATGRFDRAIEQALAEDEKGETRPL